MQRDAGAPTKRAWGRAWNAICGEPRRRLQNDGRTISRCNGEGRGKDEGDGDGDGDEDRERLKSLLFCPGAVRVDYAPTYQSESDVPSSGWSHKIGARINTTHDLCMCLAATPNLGYVST